MTESSPSGSCPRDDTAAYVDGELSERDASEFEHHLAGCDVCRLALADQKKFLIALASSLDEKESITLPADFTRRVVSNAESGVSGLRRPRELAAAVFIAVALLVLLLAALGPETPALAAATAVAADKLAAVGSFLLRTGANIAFAAAVVVKSLAANLGFAGSAAGLALLAFLFVSSRRFIRRRNV